MAKKVDIGFTLVGESDKGLTMVLRLEHDKMEARSRAAFRKSGFESVCQLNYE